MNRRTVLRSIGWGVGGLTLAPLARHVSTASLEHVTLTTGGGKVRGVRIDGIHVFKGVRYGADTSPRRFRPPVAPAAWTGVRDALEFGPIAPQSSAGGRASGEDCLHLNAWTPGLGDNGRRPVMVWFHPGAFSSGTSNDLEADGARLSRRGNVVVVTVNHRLNVLGHLYLAAHGGEEFADSGNVGLLDLILALQWVREHAAALGGDPGNVTVFGQSGGGAKIATLMAMPAARGLFHRAITMSGQQITASRVTTAVRHADRFLAALQIPKERVRDLATLPLEQLVKASRAPSYMGPVKDGRSLPRDPFDPDAPPQSAGIPMILGNTNGETRTLIGRGDPSIFALTWDSLQPKLEANSPFMGDLDRRQVIAAYRKWYPSYSPADVFFAATTASRSWRGQVIEATPIDGGKWAGRASGAGRAGKAGRAGAASGAGAGRERQAAHAPADGTNRRSPVLPALPAPPAPLALVFDLTRRATMVFDKESRVVDDPRSDERRLFSQVTYVQPGT